MNLRNILPKIFKPAILSIFLFTLALSANAQIGEDINTNLTDAGSSAGVTDETGEAPGIEEIIGNIIQAALIMIGTIFLVLIVYGGYLWMTARGNQEQVKKAKDIVIQASIGLVLVLAAWAITFFILIATLEATKIYEIT